MPPDSHARRQALISFLAISVPKRPVRPSSGPDGTDGSARKGAWDGRVSWRPSGRQPGTDWRGLQMSQVVQFFW